MLIVYCTDGNKEVNKQIKKSIDSVRYFNPQSNICVVSSSEKNDFPSYIRFLYFNPEKYYNKFEASHNGSYGVYFRLLLPEILKEETKCVYLDSDILCQGSINELDKIDIPYLGCVCSPFCKYRTDKEFLARYNDLFKKR